MTKLLWLVLPLFLSGFMLQPVDNSKFIEKKQVVYTGNTLVGKLKFAVNSGSGMVVQVSKVSEASDKPQTIESKPGEECPDGYKPTNVMAGAHGERVYVCELTETPQIHQLEIPLEDIQPVCQALLHFEHELKFVQRAVIEEEK